MDFFEHQRTAKTNTLWLSILFAGAVTLIILLIYGVVLCVAAYQQQVSAASGVARSAPSAEFSWWHTELFLTSAGGTLFVVLLGTACKTWSLAGGGTAVAESLGGRQLSRNTTDPAESRKTAQRRTSWYAALGNMDSIVVTYVDWRSLIRLR